ncbi:MAG: PEP-CTERM sorting domain-containing protein [Planctomycetota bacterium]|nr:PEP-CTERM sorting domain-containing protein [Planctomycetota bacterium]
MKKFSIALVVACLMALTAGTVSADVWRGTEYDFVDVIDYWTWDGEPGGNFDTVLITENNPLEYQHDITGYGVPGEWLVTEAWLELDFTNDFSDSYWYGVIVKWDHREYVEMVFDGSEWHDIGEVDDAYYEVVVGIEWLNDDGILDVVVTVSNPLGTASASLDHSALYGNLEVVPVPGAVLLGVLGLGAAGMKLRRRNAA